MMREDYDIASEEWFIPLNWERGNLEELLEEKQSAVDKAKELYEGLQKLQDRIQKAEYEKLQTKFLNLKLVTEIWLLLMKIYMNYVKYFETRDGSCELALEQDLETIMKYNYRGIDLLGNAFYCLRSDSHGGYVSQVEKFVGEIKQSFALEKKAVESIEQESDILDYVVCGGAMEGHRLQKEVNFSDTLVQDGALCRIPGSLRGLGWCSINAHGWFSYEIAVTPNAMNTIKIVMGSSGEELDVSIGIEEQNDTIREKIQGTKEYSLQYHEHEGKDKVRIRFDKVSGYTPYIFSIKVLK